MKAKLRMLMNRKAFESVAMILGILFMGAFEVASWGILAGILAAYFVLNYGIPSKYTPHVATFEAMIVAGAVVALLLIFLFGTIPPWLRGAGIACLAISLATSMFHPFHFLTKAEKENPTL